jgi:hypothetical protein
MATYKNTSKGARTIKLAGGGYKLVEAGASITVRDDQVVRVGPDLVLDKSARLPKPPAAAVKAVTAKPRTRKAPARRKAAAKPKAG